MSTDRMIVIVPTRSRPHNVAPLVNSFTETGAFEDGVELCLVVDRDDPAFDDYLGTITEAVEAVGNERRTVTWLDATHHEQLVPKLNKAADYLRITQSPRYLGFMGDDHRPRSAGWVKAYRDELELAGTGIVSCPDGHRPDDLPTHWVMTADIVEALRRMVPAPVEHLYCDNAVRDLAKEAECWRWRADLLVDHLNPYAGQRAPMDEQYKRVNSDEQYRTDRAQYRTWKRHGGLAADAHTVRTLKGHP
jgi:hypothetical protein